MNPPNRAELAPGSRLAFADRIEARSLLLCYNNVHLPKPEYKSWLAQIIEDKTFVEVGYLRVAHRTVGEDKLYTYVVMKFKGKLQCSQKIFSWQGTIPETRIFANGGVDHAIEFLDSWPCHIVRLPVRQWTESSESESEDTEPELATCSSVVRTMIANMQEQSISEINSGTVSVINCTTVDNLDLNSLEECLTVPDLSYVNKAQYEFSFHVPRTCDIGIFMQAAKARGWLCDILVFDLTRRQLRSWEERSLSKLAIAYPETSIWLLTRSVPQVPTWKVYKLDVQCSMTLSSS